MKSVSTSLRVSAQGKLLLSCASAAILCSLAQPAFAQDATEAQADAADQSIVVTGSRIVRRDYEANSPIVTADEGLFENSSSASLESNLNKLPQFTPTLNTPTAGAGDIQPTARNTPGSATISLRGIGTNRTLVLINGRRGAWKSSPAVLRPLTVPTPSPV